MNSSRTRILAALASLVLAAPVRAQETQVAHFATGKRGTASYQRLSFQVTGGRPDGVVVASGADEDERPVTVRGHERCGAARCLLLRLPGGDEWLVEPRRLTLRVRPRMSRAGVAYAWEYNGPINGIGMSCLPCVDGPHEAIALVRKYFRP